MNITLTLTSEMLNLIQEASRWLESANEWAGTYPRNEDAEEAYYRSHTQFGFHAAHLMGLLNAEVAKWQTEVETMPSVLKMREAHQAGYDTMYPYWKATWDGECAIAPECPYSDPYLIAEWRKGSGEAARAVGYPF